jgi:membrane-associated phospholipid phosphatase
MAARGSRRALVALPPTRADLAVARTVVRIADPTVERALRVVTWLADEKIVLTGAVLFWVYARLGSRKPALAPEADRMLCCAALAGALPHLFKRLVDRKRPDRAVVHGRRHGIPRSGNAWNSFPSGHALHLGAVAGSIRRLAPKRFRPLVWPVAAALAASRIMLLAHYPSDVAAGLAMGVLIDRTVGRISRWADRVLFARQTDSPRRPAPSTSTGNSSAPAPERRPSRASYAGACGKPEGVVTDAASSASVTSCVHLRAS